MKRKLTQVTSPAPRAGTSVPERPLEPTSGAQTEAAGGKGTCSPLSHQRSAEIDLLLLRLSVTNRLVL